MKLPDYVQIEPVGQCNLRCQMCPIQFRQDGPPYGPPAFMAFETYTRLVDQFTNLKELHLQGLGEPMMHPRFFDMVAYAAGKDIRVTTNSNMTLLNASRAERCVTCGLDTLHISMDGATADTYERIRVRGHFDRLLRNLELLLEVRRRSGQALPHLHLVLVVMRQNLHELPDLVWLAGRYAIEEVFIQHLAHDFGEPGLPERYRPMREFVNAETLLEEDPQWIEHFFDEADRVARRLGIRLRLPRTRPRPHPPGTPGPERCDWPWRGAYISYDGQAMPCCMIATPDRLNLGNWAKQEAIEMWNSDTYGQFRRALASDEPPDVCRSCSIYWGTF